jgi:hypothetical protein
MLGKAKLPPAIMVAAIHGVFAMCDLAYVNFLREKVRQLEAEEKRASRDVRFIPYVTPVQPQSQDAADRKPPH